MNGEIILRTGPGRLYKISGNNFSENEETVKQFCVKTNEKLKIDLLKIKIHQIDAFFVPLLKISKAELIFNDY